MLRQAASLEVAPIRYRNNIEKSTWKPVDISSVLNVKSMSSYPRWIDVILSTWIYLSWLMKYRRTFDVKISMSNRRQIDEDVSTWISKQ